MPENNGPQPSGSSLREPEQVAATEIQLMETRLAALEARLEADGLGWESEYRKKLLREVDQRIELRQVAFIVAGFVLAGMAALAWAAFLVVSEHAGTVEAATGALKVGLFVTPVISITAVTVMLVIGAFKKPKDDDEVNLPNLLAEFLKSYKG